MIGKHGRWYILILGAVFLAASVLGCSRKSTNGGKHIPVTKENLAEAIDAYAKKETALKGGSFLVYDSKTKKPLVLTLEKIHKDRLSRVGDEEYFACADFSTPGGKLYDLDIFMKGPDKEHLEVAAISIHKEDDKERYTWFEEEGTWKKKPLDAAAEEGAEHPEEKGDEHPSEHPQ